MATLPSGHGRRPRALALTLIGASMATQSALSASWARIAGSSQDRALIAIIVLHAALLTVIFWRTRTRKHDGTGAGNHGA